VHLFAGEEIGEERWHDIVLNTVQSGVDAFVVEEDRYLVLSAESEILEVDLDGASIQTEVQNTSPAEPGTVLVKGRNPIQLLAIVHDLDRSPTWQREWVEKALVQIFREVNRRGIESLALPVLGSVHGSLFGALCRHVRRCDRESHVQQSLAHSAARKEVRRRHTLSVFGENPAIVSPLEK
jgi:hypothetical protein